MCEQETERASTGHKRRQMHAEEREMLSHHQIVTDKRSRTRTHVHALGLTRECRPTCTKEEGEQMSATREMDHKGDNIKPAQPSESQ